MSQHKEKGKSQKEIDKENRQKNIDNVIEEHGMEILNSLQEHGVLVEGQFSLHRQAFEIELEYLEEKLKGLGLEPSEIEDDDNEEEDTREILELGYYNNPGIGCHHLYYVYLGHQEKQTAQENAIKVHRIKNAVEILKHNKNAINLDDLKEILKVLREYAVDKEVQDFLNRIL